MSISVVKMIIHIKSKSDMNGAIEARNQIVGWLQNQSINYSSDARICRHKNLAKEYRAKSSALSAAASYILEARIEEDVKR